MDVEPHACSPSHFQEQDYPEFSQYQNRDPMFVFRPEDCGHMAWYFPGAAALKVVWLTYQPNNPDFAVVLMGMSAPAGPRPYI